jgi:hypothetical protein
MRRRPRADPHIDQVGVILRQPVNPLLGERAIRLVERFRTMPVELHRTASLPRTPSNRRTSDSPGRSAIGATQWGDLSQLDFLYPGGVLPRSVLLFVAALMVACESGRHVREYTYPPSFEYIDESRLDSAMWMLAREVGRLEQTLRRPAGDPAAQQREVAEILLRMDEAAAGISTPGRVTQHPLLNRHLPRFREQLQRARADAGRTPPNYFTAATLAGSCSACHGSAAR